MLAFAKSTCTEMNTYNIQSLLNNLEMDQEL